ncbi:MAG: recombinase family protein [Candidatus Sericytochromatia bacterium]|nr:recombinase family protein [Candidatus Sericytochromatia bacterium]
MISVAQWEREAIAEWTVSALAYKKVQGVYLGAEPYGYRRENTKLVEVTGQAEIRVKIVAMRDDGLTLQAIADNLNASGVQTKRGCQWKCQTVKNVVDRQLAVVPA